jgi:hypothetical protein
MQKSKKTRDDLQQTITERTGVNVRVLPNKTYGWIATAIVAPARIPESQAAVDPVAAELRALYDLKE